MAVARRKTVRAGKSTKKTRTNERSASKRATPARLKKSVALGSRPRRKAGKQARKLPAIKAPLGLRFREGCGGTIHIVERFGTSVDQVSQTCQIKLAWIEQRDLSKEGRGPSHRSERTKRAAKGSLAVSARTWRAMAAVGHAVRLKILGRLLDGPATYQSLKHTTKLKPGPLYHHINQLRLAGLILPKQRDLYELTRGGRNLVIALTLIGPLIGDRRRRPIQR